jgi:hypothetical protein
MNNSPVSGDITLEKKPSKKRVYTFLAMLFAFASALLLWFYVLGYDSPYYEKEFNVPVNVEGESALRESMGYTVLSDFSFTIKVTVSGTQTEVNKLRSSDIKAFVDVSGVTVSGNNTLPISVRVSNENEITVVEKSVESAVIFIDTPPITIRAGFSSMIHAFSPSARSTTYRRTNSGSHINSRAECPWSVSIQIPPHIRSKQPRARHRHSGPSGRTVKCPISPA